MVEISCVGPSNASYSQIYSIFLEVFHPLRFDLKFKISLQVCGYLDFLTVSEMDEYPEVVLIEYLRGLDVRFDSSEVEMRLANIFDLQP